MGRWDEKKKQQRRNTLSDDAYKRLSTMFREGKGRSRNEDKKAGISDKYIYSASTYNTYRREAKHYIQWLRKEHPEVLHLKQGKRYINEYLQFQIESQFSSWTISTRKAALVKLYGITGEDLIATPPRERADIVRSRYAAKRDARISSEKQEYYARIGRATGLRRREMERITGDALVKRGDQYWIYVDKGTKGGKCRYAIIHGQTEQETRKIVKLFQQAGKLRVCPDVPDAFDEHAQRALYAKTLYNAYARPVAEIPRKERYIMRKDRAGEVLDKRAMLFVSRCLGHSRIDVIAEHYLY